MNGSDDRRLARNLLLPVLGASLLLAACASDSIEGSPLRQGFNRALDACEGQSRPDQRQDCFQDAMQDYTTRYEAYLKRKQGTP